MEVQNVAKAVLAISLIIVLSSYLIQSLKSTEMDNNQETSIWIQLMNTFLGIVSILMSTLFPANRAYCIFGQKCAYGHDFNDVFWIAIFDLIVSGYCYHHDLPFLFYANYVFMGLIHCSTLCLIMYYGTNEICFNMRVNEHDAEFVVEKSQTDSNPKNDEPATQSSNNFYDFPYQRSRKEHILLLIAWLIIVCIDMFPSFVYLLVINYTT